MAHLANGALVYVNNLQVENVRSFKFLGATITHNPMHSNMNEIRLKIVLARSKFHKYRHLLNNKNIYLKTRLILFNAFVRSVLTYSMETLTLTALQMQKLESAYLRLLRSMVKDGFKTKTPSDYHLKYTNQQILTITKQDPLQHYIKKIQTSFISHQVRLPNQGLVKTIVFNSNKKASVGRPMKTLLQEVSEYHGMGVSQFLTRSMKRII